MTSKILILLIISFTTIAKDKVIYKYKQYEKFDLGDMEIKGELIAPGDLTVKERSNRFLNRKLYKRTEYSKELIYDIKYMR
jgi:hypothetical protein